MDPSVVIVLLLFSSQRRKRGKTHLSFLFFLYSEEVKQTVHTKSLMMGY